MFLNLLDHQHLGSSQTQIFRLFQTIGGLGSNEIEKVEIGTDCKVSETCVYFYHSPTNIMQTLAKQIIEHASGLPEGTPLTAKELLHLGNRAAVDQVLSRLVSRGALLRAGRGIYVLPVKSSFGTRAPSASKMVEGLATHSGETVTSHGATAANALGLTTQVPMRAVYLTSGRSRQLKLGAQLVEFRHAPVWQLVFPGRAAGDVIRALAWLGPKKATEAIRKLQAKLPSSELAEVASVRARLPTWMAQEVSALVPHG